MSCCFITTVDGGSRRLFLPNLLRTMVIVMVMMMMARSTSGGVSIESISPEFEVGSSARINITCKVAGDLNLVTVLKLLRNETQVIQWNYNKGTKEFQRGQVTSGFDCKIPANKGWNGEYQCWKNNPNCEDATNFQCATNNEKSPPKSVKMKSALKQLTLDNVDYELNQIITFICTANVATSSQRTVQFQWSVKQGSNNLDEVQRSVKVPTSNNCKVQVQSRFDYNITIRDYPNITITCSAFGMELHTEVSIVDKISILATQAPVVDTAGVSIKSISPAFEVGSARINITCKVISGLNLVTVLKLLRNGTQVIQWNYNKGTGGFQRGVVTSGFDCKIPAYKGWNGEYQCWKNNPNCEDATTFQCATNKETSPPKSVKTKSYMKDLTSDTKNHKINQISTFRCHLDFVPNSEEYVLFIWSVTRGSNEATVSLKYVNVPKINKCYVSLESQFDYNVTIEDYPNITITCLVLNMKLDFEVFLTDKILCYLPVKGVNRVEHQLR